MRALEFRRYPSCRDVPLVFCSPFVYASQGSSTPDEYPLEGDAAGRVMQLVRHVSFVDCPGHDILMATMLNGGFGGFCVRPFLHCLCLPFPLSAPLQARP